MRITHLAASAFVGLIATVSPAQTQPQRAKCTASVTNSSVVKSTAAEKTWDLAFNVSVGTCRSASGEFNFSVELTASGNTEQEQLSANFTTQNGQSTTVTTSYVAAARKEVKGVTGISVKRCFCAK